MKVHPRKQAAIYATRLAQAFDLCEEFVEHIAEGDLYYSVAMTAQHVGFMEKIDRNHSVFGLHVKEIENAEGVYVYHCILTGPFLSFLYVPSDPAQWEKAGPIVGSDEVHAYMLELNELCWGQGIITLGSYDHVLIRLH